jgi:Holliday junction DNA helicase RuvA
MIASLTGELYEVDDAGRISIKSGPFVFELLVPAADVQTLAAQVGTEITLHTLFYLEGDSNGGNIEPRLIGFLRKEDKRFFDIFTTVKGIGPKTALKALTVPVGVIAQAIESKDARTLVGLKGIGKRTAELIIAELAGKVEDFAFAVTEHANGNISVGGRRVPIEEDAISTLVQLGERRSDAEHLLDRAKQQGGGKLVTTEALVREMLRMRTVRAG